MDIISVTDAALRNCHTVLRQMSNISDEITSKLKEALAAEISSLDSEFKKHIEQFIADVDELNDKLKYCTEENATSISDRLNRLSDYENRGYRKRNLF